MGHEVERASLGLFIQSSPWRRRAGVFQVAVRWKERMQGPWYISSESEDHPGTLALPVLPELGSSCISMPSGLGPDWDRVWAIAKISSFWGVGPITLLLATHWAEQEAIVPLVWVKLVSSHKHYFASLHYLAIKKPNTQTLQNKSVKC